MQMGSAFPGRAWKSPWSSVCRSSVPRCTNTEEVLEQAEESSSQSPQSFTHVAWSDGQTWPEESNIFSGPEGISCKDAF